MKPMLTAILPPPIDRASLAVRRRPVRANICRARIGSSHTLGRKGFGTDAIYFVCIIFAIAIVGVVSWYFFDLVNTALQGNPQVSSDAKAILTTQDTRFHNVFDYGLLTLFVAGTVGLMITSYMLQSNPALFWVLMLVVAILGGIAGILSNGFSTAMSSDVLTNALASFPITNFLMANYLAVIVVVMFLMLITFFSKGAEA